jgi:hypothetical protein
MLLTLDNLAHRYQCLPSEALVRANTFDLRVLEISGRWSQRQHEAAERGQPQGSSRQPNQEQLLDMIRRVKEQSQ